MGAVFVRTDDPHRTCPRCGTCGTTEVMHGPGWLRPSALVLLFVFCCPVLAVYPLYYAPARLAVCKLCGKSIPA